MAVEAPLPPAAARSAANHHRIPAQAPAAPEPQAAQRGARSAEAAGNRWRTARSRACPPVHDPALTMRRTADCAWDARTPPSPVRQGSVLARTADLGALPTIIESRRRLRRRRSLKRLSGGLGRRRLPEIAGERLGAALVRPFTIPP